MRHRIFSETSTGCPRVWRVQIAGQDRPVNEGALTWAGAVKLLERRLEADEWWRAHDPLAELPAGTPAPRPRRFRWSW